MTDPAEGAPNGRILGIDTATSTAIVALGSPNGELLAEDSWHAGYRHGEELLGRIDRLLRRNAVALGSISGIVVGTGPGAFTGLRVGLATAKGLARGLSIPIVGVPTSQALLLAAERSLAADGRTRRGEVSGGSRLEGLALLLPAGPADRTLVLHGAPRLLPGGQDPDIPAAIDLVAVDLGERADPAASALGAAAVRGLGAALMELGAARLSSGEGGGDAVARLVPEYVTLPRGVQATTGEVRWSRDLP